MNPLLIIISLLWSFMGFYIGITLLINHCEHFVQLPLVILFVIIVSPILPVIGLILYLDFVLSEWYFHRGVSRKNGAESEVFSKKDEAEGGVLCKKNTCSPSVSHNKDDVKTEFMERDEEEPLCPEGAYRFE